MSLTTGVINEEWRSISGYENYQVSNIGRVRNVSTGRILKECPDNRGYLRVGLCKDKRGIMFKIHRLVANEFIPNPENKPFVDHINNDVTENTIRNLRWATYHENQGNSKKRNNTSSIYKGVHWNKNVNKWRASIYINGRTKSLGCYGNEKEAARKYNEVALEYFQDFAKLNEISDSEDETEEETENTD